MSVYIDTGILLTAAGTGQQPSDLACRQIVSAIGEGRLEAMISCGVVQELLHAADWRHARAQGLELSRLVMRLFPHARPLSAATMERACALLRDHQRLGVRIALQVAAMHEAGINDVIADDEDYGLISGIRRLAPLDACRHYRL